IITTRKGSRPFDPAFGCDITNELFENMTPLTGVINHCFHIYFIVYFTSNAHAMPPAMHSS
ncbi:hypothetical protein, partial [Xanthomonas campestris]|uniref:hypothetical protein n=1 Tax=Xanthomonas campestris TaxID=339 RepID=UPI00403A78FA